jgi:hypothetical protein
MLPVCPSQGIRNIRDWTHVTDVESAEEQDTAGDRSRIEDDGVRLATYGVSATLEQVLSGLSGTLRSFRFAHAGLFQIWLRLYPKRASFTKDGLNVEVAFNVKIMGRRRIAPSYPFSHGAALVPTLSSLS